MRSWAGRRRHGAHPDAQGGCRPAGPGRVGAGGERPPGAPGRGSTPPTHPPDSCRFLLQLKGGFKRSPAGVRRCAATPGAVRSRPGGGCWGFFQPVCCQICPNAPGGQGAVWRRGLRICRAFQRLLMQSLPLTPTLSLWVSKRRGVLYLLLRWLQLTRNFRPGDEFWYADSWAV